MKFERIKKSHKKEIIIGGLVVLGIVSAITLTTSRANYKLTQSIPIVRGTVNYKPYDLKVVAINVSEDGINYAPQDDIPASGYVLNSKMSMCKIGNSEAKEESITIEYNAGKINILGVSKTNTKCSLYFDKYVELTSEDTLAKLNITNVKEQTDTLPDFKTTATTDEGIFKVADGMYGGNSYYWRGAVLNNHVIFGKYSSSTPNVYYGFKYVYNGLFKEYDSLSACQNASDYNQNCTLVPRAGRDICWRIIRINGDGSIRLIYNGTATNGQCPENGENTGSLAVSNQKYNDIGSSFKYNESYLGWTYKLGYQRPSSTPDGTETDSNAKVKTEEWFTSSITGTNVERVADGKFCNDRSGRDLSLYNPKPTLSCPEGDVYTLKVGAITADELIYGGGKYDSDNKTCYLYNGFSYWTMTARDRSSSDAMAYEWDRPGYLFVSSLSNEFGLRPVINLKADTTFQSGGLGTSDMPYVVQ